MLHSYTIVTLIEIIMFIRKKNAKKFILKILDLLNSYTIPFNFRLVRLHVPPDAQFRRTYQWRTGSALKTRRREVPGSIPGRACLPNGPEFSVVFSEARVNPG